MKAGSNFSFFGEDGGQENKETAMPDRLVDRSPFSCYYIELYPLGQHKNMF